MTLGDMDRDLQSTSIGARDDLAVTLGVCKEPQAASFTAKDDLSVTLGSVGLDGNPKTKLPFMTQLQEENDEGDDEKQSQPPTAGDHLPAIGALSLPSKEMPTLQSPEAPIRHPLKLSTQLLDQTMDSADVLMDTVITAAPDERSKAFVNSSAAKPAEFDRATDRSSVSSEAARESAEPQSPPLRRADTAPTAPCGRSFTALNPLDMTFETYDAACMELQNREQHELELHLSLRESLLAQLPGSAFPQGMKSMSQVSNVTPRATLLVRPATMDKVGTVCRKPRPKAMQRGRISAP